MAGSSVSAAPLKVRFHFDAQTAEVRLWPVPGGGPHSSIARQGQQGVLRTHGAITEHCLPTEANEQAPNAETPATFAKVAERGCTDVSDIGLPRHLRGARKGLKLIEATRLAPSRRCGRTSEPLNP